MGEPNLEAESSLTAAQGYVVKRGTRLFHGTTKSLEGPLRPSTWGKYGYGLYLCEDPEVVSKHITPHSINSQMLAVRTLRDTHHFQYDDIPSDSDLKTLAHSVYPNDSDKSVSLFEKMRGKVGDYVIDYIIGPIVYGIDLEDDNSDIAKQEKAKRIRNILMKASYDGAWGDGGMELDRKGTILTFFKPEETLVEESRQ